MGEWVSVKEKLPKANTRVLCVDMYGNMYVSKYRQDFCLMGECVGWPEDFPPTHWMPLPPPPKGAD